MADYDLRAHDPLTVQRRQLQELDMYENPGTDFYDAYYSRAIPFSDRIKKQIPNEPGAYEVHKRLLENAPELYQGHSNLTANIDQYFHPRAQMYSTSKHPEMFGPGAPYEQVEAGVPPMQPAMLYINPKHAVMNTSSLLGHEMGHAGHLSLENRLRMANQDTTSWYPKWSPDFKISLRQLSRQKDSPYYQRPIGYDTQFAQGPGTVPVQGGGDDETFAYLLGREAELPQGQTLLDDPATAKLFKQFPNMYQEYISARDRVRQSWQNPRR